MKRTITRKRTTKYLRQHSFDKLLCRQGTLEEELTLYATTKRLLKLEGLLSFRLSYLRIYQKRLRSGAALEDREHLVPT